MKTGDEKNQSAIWIMIFWWFKSGITKIYSIFYVFVNDIFYWLTDWLVDWKPLPIQQSIALNVYWTYKVNKYITFNVLNWNKNTTLISKMYIKQFVYQVSC